MELLPTPRANFELLPQLINKKVLLVGKVYNFISLLRSIQRDLHSWMPSCALGHDQSSLPLYGLAQVESVAGNEARVKTTDGATVTMALRKGPAFQSEFVEFESIVNTATTLTEVDRAAYGSKLGDSSSYWLADIVNSLLP